MDNSASLLEGRKIGRNIYLLGCVTVGLHAYGVRMAEGEHFPLELPTGFPIAGVFALVIAFLAVSLFARNAEHLAYWLGAYASKQQLETIAPPADLSEVASYPADNKHFIRAAVIELAPVFGTSINKFIYIVDQVLPIIFAIIVIIGVHGSIYKLYSYSYGPPSEATRGEAAMKDNISPLSIARRFGRATPVVRWTNPDGSCGGLVSSTAIVPDNAFVPFDTIIDDGVKIDNDAIIPARSILMKNGKTVKNTVQILNR